MMRSQLRVHRWNYCVRRDQPQAMTLFRAAGLTAPWLLFPNQKAGASLIADGLGAFEPLRMTAAAGHPGRDMADVALGAPGAVQEAVQGRAQGTASDHSRTAAAQDWLSSVEKSGLTPRYYLTVGLLVLQE